MNVAFVLDYCSFIVLIFVIQVDDQDHFKLKMVRVTKLKLHRTISEIMNKGNLDSLTTKKIRLLCEAKYNTDLSERMKSQELRAAEINQQANQVNVTNQRSTHADKNNVTSDEESSASEDDGSGDSEEEEGGSEDGNGSDGSEGNATGGSEEGSSCSGSESCSDSECSSDSSDEETDSKVPASTSKKTATILKRTTSNVSSPKKVFVNASSPKKHSTNSLPKKTSANASSPKKVFANAASSKKASASSTSFKEPFAAGPSKAVSVIAGPSKGTTAISGSPKKAAVNAVPAKKDAAITSTTKKAVPDVGPAKKASVNTKKRKTNKEGNGVQSKKPKKDDTAKKIELDDAALARKLQAEEWNFRRATVNKLFRNAPQKKNEEQIKKRKPCPFLKKCLLSPALAEVLGTNEMSRPDVVQKMWSVVRERNLFDASNKQYALCDEQLKNVFGKKRIRLIGMMKYLKHHIKDIN